MSTQLLDRMEAQSAPTAGARLEVRTDDFDEATSAAGWLPAMSASDWLPVLLAKRQIATRRRVESLYGGNLPFGFDPTTQTMDALTEVNLESLQDLLAQWSIIKTSSTVIPATPTGTVSSQTKSRVSDGPEYDRESVTAAAMLAYVREHIGLTWDQMARMFNVSRRAVHLWAAGGNLSAAKYEVLIAAADIAQHLRGDTAEDRRMQFMTPRGADVSYWAQLARQSAPGTAINGPALSPAEAFGVAGPQA